MPREAHHAAACSHLACSSGMLLGSRGTTSRESSRYAHSSAQLFGCSKKSAYLSSSGKFHVCVGVTKPFPPATVELSVTVPLPLPWRKSDPSTDGFLPRACLLFPCNFGYLSRGNFFTVHVALDPFPSWNGAFALLTWPPRFQGC